MNLSRARKGSSDELRKTHQPGLFLTHAKLENSLSYCVNACDLRRSERFLSACVCVYNDLYELHSVEANNTHHGERINVGREHLLTSQWGVSLWVLLTSSLTGWDLTKLLGKCLSNSTQPKQLNP